MQTLFIEPNSAFSVQYSVEVLFMVPRGLWGFVSSRWGWSLFPVGCRIRD